MILQHPKFKILSSDISHHAYCIEGEAEIVFPKLFVFTEKKLGISTRGNPDFYFREFKTLGIDEGRFLHEHAWRKPLDPHRGKCFVLAAHSLTHEVQNSLLKIFEDPPQKTYFFLVVPSSEILLPTLRSRLEPLALDTGEKKGNTRTGAIDIEQFLSALPNKRLEMVEPFIEEKDTQGTGVLLDQLEEILAKKLKKQVKKEIVEALREILKSRRYLRSRSPSVKMIVSNLALILPVEKGREK